VPQRLGEYLIDQGHAGAATQALVAHAEQRSAAARRCSARRWSNWAIRALGVAPSTSV
jgi:hypothetical protein